MRTAQYQIKINKEILDNNLAKLKTSINNLKEGRGHSEYIRHIHVQNDCLAVALSIEKYLLLQMMERTDEYLVGSVSQSAEDSVSNAE